MSDESDESVWETAKDRLVAAIKDFYGTVEPDVYVDDWALVVHKDSIALTQENQSVVSLLVPSGQAFHRTTGLLTHAIDSARGRD